MSRHFIIAYGYFCPKDIVFPWDECESIVDWWLDKHRYEIQDHPGIWLTNNPVPVLVLNVDTKGYSDYFIAVRNCVEFCDNNDILHFYPDRLSNFNCCTELIDCVSFINYYNVRTIEPYPRWYVVKAR